MKKVITHCKFIIFLSVILVSCNPNEEEPTVNSITGHPVLSRETVLQAWETIYLGTVVDDTQWNGSWQDCDPGTLPQSVHDKVLARINFYRAMCGLPSDVVFDDNLNSKCQEAALMIHANGSLSHDPPTNWHCWTTAGHDGCASSNIGYGTADLPVHTSRAIDYYIQDEKSGTPSMGHRRWLLYSRAKTMGHGSTSQANATWVSGNTSNPVPDNIPDFIAYPPPGFIPFPLCYKFWTLSAPLGNFHSATVVMTDQNGNEIDCPITYTSGDGDPIIGDYTIAWQPDITLNENEDNIFNVKVENVLITGKIYSFEYEVTVIPIEE